MQALLGPSEGSRTAWKPQGEAFRQGPFQHASEDHPHDDGIYDAGTSAIRFTYSPKRPV
jgi:hypothetical protein